MGVQMEQEWSAARASPMVAGTEECSLTEESERPLYADLFKPTNNGVIVTAKLLPHEVGWRISTH